MEIRGCQDCELSEPDTYTDQSRELLKLEEYAETKQLKSAIKTILPALQNFIQFEEPEHTAKDQTKWSRELEEKLPQVGAGAKVVLEKIRDIVIPYGLHTGAPGFSGWVTTMPTTVPTAASLAATIAGPQRRWVQTFNQLEALALRWLSEMLGLTESYQGIFVSGGSTANLIGLGVARQAAAERLKIDVANDGMSSIHEPRIYASTEIHHVIVRAAAILGMGRRSVVPISTDNTFRIDVSQLHDRLQQDIAIGYTPIAVVASAGTVNTGAIDPLPELAKLCHEYNVWLHVDGAYGLLGILDPELTSLYGDLALADSLVVDPHKWLAVPVGCGAVFVRDRALLERAFTLEPADYMEGSLPIYTKDGPYTSQFDSFGYAFNDFGIELSAPSRGVQVWAALKEIGVDGVRARIRRHNAYARYLAERVKEVPDLELVAPVTLSICCFRCVPQHLQHCAHDEQTKTYLNNLNRDILKQVRAQGNCMPSATTVDGNFVIRSCYINPRTTLTDVEALVAEIKSCGKKIDSKLFS